ncbi:hypothetical protein JZ751_016708 [Albula glossodonta]|uniref:Uncharacterized protein n=1 Tax=Albula glossodonta TaxID=121402 RepID=A0A8T2NRL0_9TELE|nr:hypothetical protein JZ751_016708 [Albula glossodonta]
MQKTLCRRSVADKGGKQNRNRTLLRKYLVEGAVYAVDEVLAVLPDGGVPHQFTSLHRLVVRRAAVVYTGDGAGHDQRVSKMPECAVDGGPYHGAWVQHQLSRVERAWSQRLAMDMPQEVHTGDVRPFHNPPAVLEHVPAVHGVLEREAHLPRVAARQKRHHVTPSGAESRQDDLVDVREHHVFAGGHVAIDAVIECSGLAVVSPHVPHHHLHQALCLVVIQNLLQQWGAVRLVHNHLPCPQHTERVNGVWKLLCGDGHLQHRAHPLWDLAQEVGRAEGEAEVVGVYQDLCRPGEQCRSVAHVAVEWWDAIATGDANYPHCLVTQTLIQEGRHQERFAILHRNDCALPGHVPVPVGLGTLCLIHVVITGQWTIYVKGD